MRWNRANVLPYVPDVEAGDDADLVRDDEDSAVAIPKSVVIDDRFDWQGDRPPNTPMDRHGDLRDARQGLHDAPSGRARGPARHVRRAGLGSGDRVPHRARRHRGRAAPDPPHRRRVVPRRARAHQLLGLLDDRLPRTALPVRRDRHPRPGGARVQGHGEGAAPRRDRGDPRRRLQPHRGGQPPRADARLQGRRQPVLLPAGPRRPALLHGLHGHRELAQRRSTRACCG